MKQIPKFKILFLLSTFYFLFSFASTEAAKLDLISQTQEIGIGQQFQVDLILDTENEAINAIEGKVIFPGDLLELKEIRDGNSIINFWVERPKIEQPGTVSFSGITPGGFNGRSGLIFSAIFETKKSGGGTIATQDVKVLKNDGAGTPAEVKISNFQFLISNQLPISQTPIAQIKDIDPPESFVPDIAKDESIFEGEWFLVFATQDKVSGIDHYEIKESRQKFFAVFKKWLPAESPQILQDQKLRSHIYVKAVDKAGNERIETVLPKYPLKWYETWWIWGIIILGALLAIIIGYLIRKFLWGKFIKSR